jgi:hypothetical protein
MSSPVTRVVSVIVVAVMPVVVVAVISRRGWRCDKPCDSPYSTADCGPEGRAVTAGSGSPIAAPLPAPMRPPPTKRCTGSYGLVQADTPTISPIATMHRVARDFVIVTFAQQTTFRRACTVQSHLCVSFLRPRLHNGTLISLKDCNAVSRDFTFPENVRWNAERQAVEFGIERSASTEGWFGSSGGSSSACCQIFWA